MRRCAALRDALYRSRSTARMPQGLATTLGGADLAVAAGVVLGAAARRTPVLIDGPVGVAAGLIARDLALESRLWLMLVDDGGHQGVQMGATLLGVTAVTELALGMGEGTAALTVLPLIQSALLLASLDPTGPAALDEVDEPAQVEPLPVPDEPVPATADAATAEAATAEPDADRPHADEPHADTPDADKPHAAPDGSDPVGA
jgi:hypothetical protein